MSNKSLLVELLVEELPPKSLKKLGEAFAELLSASLKQQGLAADNAAVTGYATPRRLAVHITHVFHQGAQQPLKIKLMPVSIGLDAEGKPTPALTKKLQSLGLGYMLQVEKSVWDERISTAHDGKTDILFHTYVASGAFLVDGLQHALDETLVKLPIAKVMSYQLADGWSSVNFVRPVHGLVALHGADIVPINVLGLQAGRETQGHRFEASVSPLIIREADSYETQLENEGAVIASFEKRRTEIVRQLEAAAKKIGLKPIDDDALLDEVTALVECPNVLLGQFEKEFLDVPPECLILTMKANQKYFPLLDSDGTLSNKFLIVSNITPADPSAVIQGNERVVRARLADAKFFFDKDRKHTLASRVEDLNKVVYHNKLGSQGERVQRVRAIAQAIAQQLGGDALAAQADQAAMLAKADLTTDMVGEFPELQGIMGRYYAQAEGMDDEVAYAIEDHYKPRFSGDELPRNQVGVCVALADKLETLVGMFGIGEKPTGDKDPFALRRHALGVIRILIEKELPFHLDNLIQQSVHAFGNKISDAGAELTDFIFERSMGILREQGYSPQEVEAVIVLRPKLLFHIPQRLAAVRAFSALPEADSLAAANKRVSNILKKSEGGLNRTVNPDLLKEPSERALYNSLLDVGGRANFEYMTLKFTTSLQLLAALKTPIDDFFDNVMVNVDDIALRNNRLALLLQLQQTMNRVADISKLAA